jgi:DNA phosphorothioation-dependent restriction protein DptG
MAEVEFGGMTFKGGKMMILLTALSTLGGASWGAFEFYADYMNMKEIIQNIDTDAIEARNNVIETKLDEAIDYSRSIKNDLRDDFNRMEKNVDRIEDQNRVKDMIDKATERFDNRRESLQTDTEIKITAVEKRLNDKIQNVLNNPLAD